MASTHVGTAATTSRPASRGRFRRFLKYLGDPFFVLSILVLVAVFGMAATANLFFPGDPMDMVGMPNTWPFTDWGYPLGTDQLGRNAIAELFYGSRVSLLVGFWAAAIGLVIGTLVGALAGYLGGLTENLLGRLTEIFQTIPSMMLIIVILALGRPTLGLISFAVGLTSWTMIARLARAEFKSLRQADFVVAARGLGYGTVRIIFLEILPNAMPTLIVATSVLIANAILTEASVSFLNLGDPNVVSWGTMIGDGRAQLRTEWYLSAIPGLATVLTVLAVNLIGDRLTDILNPRSDRRP